MMTDNNIPSIDKDNHEQMQAYNLIANTNSSFFLTGQAGTGKTTFLQNVEKLVNKNFIILAPTGIAAILAGGETIHSFFGLPLQACPPGTCGKVNETKITTLQHTDTIIIDEVSMVRSDIMDAIDCTLRQVLKNNLPFGGKQMVFVGDMFQLPPVVIKGPEKDMLRDIYNSDTFFFFESEVIKRIRLVKIEFLKVYRQNDKQFLEILKRIRSNKARYTDLLNLNTRIGQPEENEMAITLASANRTVDEINNQRLEDIDEPEYVYEGIIEGRFEEKRFPVEPTLRLKVGSQVMFVRNDPSKRWGNGTIGKVCKLTKDEITVKLSDDSTHTVNVCTWESMEYTYDRETRKLTKKVIGTFTQFPLRLAWAITIHKSQGMTFDRMYLDLSQGMFVPGQLYVALSRVRSLDGLFLSNAITRGYIFTSSVILEYAKGYNNIKEIRNETAIGKAVYEPLRIHDYDTAAKAYLKYAFINAVSSNISEAVRFSRLYFDSVIDDEAVFGSIYGIPNRLSKNKSKEAQLLIALFYLYSNNYNAALSSAESVLEQKLCTDALYIKARALSKLERYEEAVEIYSTIKEISKFNTSGLTIPDLKSLYQSALINERYLGEDGLRLMVKIINCRPNYDNAILKIRSLMLGKDKKLDETTDNPFGEILSDFNSEITETEFIEKLKLYRERTQRYITFLILRIKSDI